MYLFFLIDMFWDIKISAIWLINYYKRLCVIINSQNLLSDSISVSVFDEMIIFVCDPVLTMINQYQGAGHGLVHRHKFRTLASSTNILRYSFTHRTVPEWYALPASTVEAGTPDGFKACLAGLSAQSD